MVSLRVAVIGAGFLGSLAALRLARLGHAVTVIDRGGDWWSGASGVGEGKLHLGYVYLRASEAFLETTVRAAVLFQRGVEEAVGRKLEWPTLRGVDFIYQFGAGSSLGPVEFCSHAERLAGIADRVSRECGDEYLGRRIDRPTIANIVENVHGMSTPESMVDVPMLRRDVVAAITSSPAVTPRFGEDVVDVSRRDGAWTLGTRSTHDGRPRAHGPYDLVVNCSWDGAERLDAMALGRPPRRINYRLRQYVTGVSPDPPTARTIVHGAFGDYVSFPDGRIYMTWYPAGLLGFFVGEEPPSEWRAHAVERPAAPSEVMAVMEGLCPYVPEAGRVSAARVAARVVVASGETDITDARSDLHDRETVAIEEEGGWIRPRSPKLSTAPYASMLLADHVGRRHACR